jgi:predicted lipid-binding transport protein (Tim44 family)
VKRWDPARFNWWSVLNAPNVSPSLPAVWVFGVGVGLLIGARLTAGLIVIGVLALFALLEWLRVVGRAALSERKRLRAYRAQH